MSTVIFCTKCGESKRCSGEVTAEVHFPNRYTWEDGEINRCTCGCDQTVMYGNSLLSVFLGTDDLWYNSFYMKPIKNGEDIVRSNEIAEKRFSPGHLKAVAGE